MEDKNAQMVCYNVNPTKNSLSTNPHESATHCSSWKGSILICDPGLLVDWLSHSVVGMVHHCISFQDDRNHELQVAGGGHTRTRTAIDPSARKYHTCPGPHDIASFDGQCYEVQKETSEYEFCSHVFLHVSVGYKENTKLSANTSTTLHPGWKYISLIHEKNLPVVPFCNKPCRCDMLDIHLKVIVWDTEAETKWTIFSRRHFQMHLVRW